MTAILFALLCAVLLIIIGFIFNIKEMQCWSGLLLWLLMIVIASFRYDGSDVLIYKSQYYLSSLHDWAFWNEADVSKETAQPLFFYLNKIFYSFNLEFSTLRFCIELASMVGVGYTIYKLTSNWMIVYVLYVVFPFYIDLIQTRNYIMNIFLMLSIIFMYKRTITSRFKSGCSIVAAGMFHSLGLIYFPFLFIDKVYKNVLFKILMAISLLSPIYIYYIINNSFYILSILGLGDSPFAFYLAYSQGAVATEISGDPYRIFIRCWVLTILCAMVLIYIERSIEGKQCIEEWKKYFISNTKNMWLCAILLLPMIGITPSMERIPRGILLPFYISLGIYFERINRKIACALFLIFIIFELWYGGIIRDSSIVFREIESNYLMDIIDCL